MVRYDVIRLVPVTRDASCAQQWRLARHPSHVIGRRIFAACDCNVTDHSVESLGRLVDREIATVCCGRKTNGGPLNITM